MRKKRGKKKTKDLGKIVAEALDHLTLIWRETVRTPRRRAVLFFGVLVFVVSMLIARQGTSRARAGAGALLLVAFGAIAVMVFRERRSWDDPSFVIDRLAGRTLPEQAQRAKRALSLLDDQGEPKEEGASPVLTRLHVARSLALIPADRITEEAGHVARRLVFATLGLGILILAATLINPWGVVEGFDVFMATHGTAPIGMRWIENPEVTARPPDYLHSEEHSLYLYSQNSLPRGTVITFRGSPIHAGRRLALVAGDHEVPFVDDGTGKVIARWPLEESVPLRIVARFGDVRIEEPETTLITSIPDLAPIVTLEDAPKQFRLAEMTADIPIRYEVTDDHGLREVQLVLRSGAREERRVLAKLDGETRSDRGGYVIKPTDSFFKKSHAPVEIRVEAKDNDPVTGPKWGVSAAFIVIPPDVGEPEAARLAALRALRDAYVDSLAHRIGHDPDVPLEKTEQAANVALLEKTLSQSFAGIQIAGRLRALIRSQAKKLETAMSAEAPAPTPVTHAALVKATETMTLVVDGVVRGLAVSDARSGAKLLADVADDLALGASQRQRESETERGALRFSAATTVLLGGEKHLATMGTLGRDFAGAIDAALLRTARAEKETDWTHAELAARDLAARLHQPDPSFGSKGSSGGHATGESGGSAGESGGEGEAGGEAERAFNEAAQELESLAQDHAGAMGEVEQALNRAQSPDDMSKLSEEGKQHAKAVRDAVREMPSIGGGSDSWTSKGAAARELSEQMARSLEEGNAADAVQSGRNAVQALDEAKRIASRERYYDDDARGAEKTLDEAKKRLEPEVKWAEDRLNDARKKAAERAGSDLQKNGDTEEKLAEQAGKLGDKAREQGSLPEPAINALNDAEQAAHDAARALKHGDAEQAMRRQRDAQQKLESAKEALGQNEEDNNESHGDDSDGDRTGGHAEIPKADAHKGPEDFRRRVVKGLALPGSARQRDAIKRYAEGLLR